MANVLVQESSLQDIADAIRTKNGTQNTYKPAQMADAIEAISGGGITPTGTMNITTNGTHDVTSYASASVAVPTGTTPTGTKQVSITQNGTTTEDVTNYANVEITANVSSSELTIELENIGWEVGAVNGGTGNFYQSNKLDNTARLRGIYVVATFNLPFNLSANWGNGEWTIMCAEYGADGKGRTQFTTVLTSDGQLPVAPYLAFVIRHSDGTTAMNATDINTIKPVLTIDTTRLTS